MQVFERGRGRARDRRRLHAQHRGADARRGHREVARVAHPHHLAVRTGVVRVLHRTGVVRLADARHLPGGLLVVTQPVRAVEELVSGLGRGVGEAVPDRHRSGQVPGVPAQVPVIVTMSL